MNNKTKIKLIISAILRYMYLLSEARISFGLFVQSTHFRVVKVLYNFLQIFRFCSSLHIICKSFSSAHLKPLHLKAIKRYPQENTPPGLRIRHIWGCFGFQTRYIIERDIRKTRTG